MEWTHAIKYSFDEKLKGLRFIPTGPLQFEIEIPEKKAESFELGADQELDISSFKEIAVFCKEENLHATISPQEEGDFFVPFSVGQSPVSVLAKRVKFNKAVILVAR